MRVMENTKMENSNLNENTSINIIAPSKKTVITSIAVLLAFLMIPSLICMFQLMSINRQQALLTQALQTQVEGDVSEYMQTVSVTTNKEIVKDSVLANPDEVDVEGGYITLDNPAVIPYDDIARAVSEILNQDYIGIIEDDMLTDLYARIDSIVTTKINEANASSGETDSSTSYSDADIQKIVDATTAIVMVDLTSYKQEMLLKYDELSDLVKSLDSSMGVSGTSVSSLTNDVTLLSNTYDAKFAQLESTDSNLQAQISSIKASNATITSQYNSLQQSIQLANSNMEQIKVLLQSKIDSLKDSSDIKDLELANNLAKAQNELNTTLATEDSKIYDNAVRIIELTNKMTAMDSSLSSAIEVLTKVTGEDSQELYNTLLVLQAALDETDSNLSYALNLEMAERRSSVNELLSMVRELQETAVTDSDDLAILIEQKTRALAADLAGTNEDMKTEYLALISETNDNLKAYVDEVNEALTATIEEKSETLDSKIDETASTLDSKIDKTDTKIDSTADTLNTKINNTSDTLDSKINDTNNTLNTKIDDNTAALNTKIDDASLLLDEKIDTSTATLDEKIDLVSSSLASQIDASNLQTQEEMAQAIEVLQAEIELLQLQVQQLQDEKLNIIDSTNYEYSENNGNTIRITVPASNPNYVK